MSRRGGRDAFRVRFLRRTTKPVATWAEATPTEPRVLASVAAKFLLCIHGQHWKSCTTCSKPAQT